MGKEKIIYMEIYRGNKIKICGKGREWFWIVVDMRSGINRNIYSKETYYSLECTMNNARKYIDRKLHL